MTTITLGNYLSLAGIKNTQLVREQNKIKSAPVQEQDRILIDWNKNRY